MKAQKSQPIKLERLYSFEEKENLFNLKFRHQKFWPYIKGHAHIALVGSRKFQSRLYVAFYALVTTARR